jgi:hypothetical protein
MNFLQKYTRLKDVIFYLKITITQSKFRKKLKGTVQAPTRTEQSTLTGWGAVPPRPPRADAAAAVRSHKLDVWTSLTAL